MSDSKIIESLLDDDPVAWETANLLHEHYGGIVRRRGIEHFNQVTQELRGALSEAIGGEWTADLESSLHKREGYPLRIRKTTWPQTNFFVIGFEYNDDDFFGGARLGLIHHPILVRDERRIRYPDLLATSAPGYKENKYWLASKTIGAAAAPDFISTKRLVEFIKDLMNHYDRVTEIEDNGWLSSLKSHNTTDN